MIVKFGNGQTRFGPGVSVELSGNEVAQAISAYLVAHGVYIDGPRTVRVNEEICRIGSVYIDPSGSAIADGIRMNGDGTKG